jgi:hypothetical protein
MKWIRREAIALFMNRFHTLFKILLLAAGATAVLLLL